MLDLPRPLAVVCHDAGATNIILAWLRATGLEDVRAVMAGPAAKLWSASFGDNGTASSLEDALEGARAVLSGTGWASDLEFRALQEAKRRGLASAAVLDHWVNYKERFIRDGASVRPDQFWVSDEEALKEARNCFPDADIRLKPNLYMMEQVRQIAPAPTAEPPELLYVLEPARSEWGRTEPGEFQALDYFVSRLPVLGLPDGVVIRLRPHPSDPPGKYDAWLARHSSLPVRLDAAGSLSEAIGRAAWVAGCESFALAIALAAGRYVVSTLPPWAPPCRLPHPNIHHLQHMS